MHPFFSRRVTRAVSLAALLLLPSLAGTALSAQDVPIGATFVCNGEHIYVENCNIRDTSDNGTCMVAHPDHLTPTGMNSYTYVKRGDLKKLLPTCQQPSAKQLSAAKAFQQRQQDVYNANAKKAEDQLNAPPPSAAQNPGAPQQGTPKSPEERQINRCITSGRLPASCTGNALLGGFSKMLTSVLPSVPDPEKAQAGPVMAGVFVGADNWRLDFIDGGVLINCAFLSPNQEAYSLKFEAGRTELVINTKPKPLVLTVHPDGSISGPGPVTINGVVASGYRSGDPVRPATYKDTLGNYYDSQGEKIDKTAGYSTFSPRTATCPALNLTSKGTGAGIQTMQTDLLKTMFGGDKGPPTPPGIRMHGIYAASTGFSVQFFPESVIVGCGPDAARAYPYTVVAGPSGAMVKIDAPDRPLAIAIRSDNTLDPGATSSYQVHGRFIAGQDNDDNFTFSPNEQTCDLALLTPSKTIPATGGAAAATTMAAAHPGSSNGGSTLSTPNAPLGNAVLSIASGLPAQPGALSPLAGRPFILLRFSYADSLARGGVIVPAGISPYKYAGTACGTRAPDCVKISQAIQASAASAARADATGKATLPGLPPGTYYLMISALYNKQSLIWGQAVEIHAGQNSIVLDEHNATPLN